MKGTRSADNKRSRSLDSKTTEKEEKFQGLVSSSTEIPSVEVLSSKAKREQVLRNILAARRRRMSRQRNGRLIDVTPRDPPDILEAQETKNEGVYASVSMAKNGTDDADKKTFKVTMEENLTTLMSEREDIESTMTMAPVTSVSKSLETDNVRKKNIVSMPDSLYKHFRPVESNIPMEDMSQFLYFGQKLQPELQNVTTVGNDSNELVSVTPTTLRRRNSSKRTSLSPLTTSTTTTTTTTTTTMTTTTATGTTIRPEEISKEETNVALERRMIEKNKVSKTTKNTLRDVPNLYYRKTRLSDSTIATNVIPSKDMTQNENTTELEEQTVERRDENGVQKMKVSRGSFRRSKKMEDTEEKVENDDVTEYRLSKDDKKSRESNSIDESTASSTTLRIVVTEPYNIESSVKDFSTTTTTTTLMPTTTTTATTLRTTTQETRRHHQQHVYAYTITNVTRLLRNYTGPGLSGETGVRGTGRVDGGSGGGRGEEGGGGGGSRRSASSEITNGRVESPSTEASAGAAGISEEPSQSAGLSTGRSVEAVGRPSTIATPSLVGERRRKVLASGAHRTGAQSAPQRAPVRIASALTRNRQQQHQQQWSDRVALVINEGSIDPYLHHHHQQHNQQHYHHYHNRSFLRKSASAVLHSGAVNPKDASPEAMPSTGTRDTVLVDADRKNSLDLERREDESRIENEASLKVNRTFEEKFTTNESLSDLKVPEETTTVDLLSSSSLTDDYTEASIDSLSSSDTKDEVRKESNNEQHSTIMTTTTTMPPEVTTSASVFPVTPKLLVETMSSDNRMLSSSTTESINRLTSSRKPDQDRPFGLAADLDPSEIQKMYRSQNTSSTESNTLPNLETSTVSINLFPNRIAQQHMHDFHESRGRSFSDKTKQEDDVLPIMQLYNTSDIFNDSSTLGPATRTVELPLEESNVTKDRMESPQEAPASRYTTPSATRKPTVKPTSKLTTKSTPRTTIRPTSTASNFVNRTRYRSIYPNRSVISDYAGLGYQPIEFNRTYFDSGLIAVSPRESVNISEVTKRHDVDAIASQETVAVVSYILATLVVFPIAVGVGLILRRLIIRNRKVLEESDTSSEISYRKDALNLENGDFKTSIEKAITKLPRIQHLCHEAEKPPPPPSQESRWEFPRDKLRLQTVLGQGNFGQVWKAEADDLTGHQGTTRLVAVKTVKEGASEREKEDLVRELEIMQQLSSHPNVVTLLGCCTEEEPHYLILEYVMYGKLLAYLRDHRTRQDFYNFSEDSAVLTSRDLTVFGYCVARGMEYLASKKIIHRDLAARNVLVDHNKLCKIADFGMSRFANEDGEVIETRHGRNALPIRWMAPESLIYSLFTTKTDVWSFGILMWEIVTLGSTPYPDMTAREVMRNVQSGYRLERPSHCRSELFRVISRCWHADPDRRPEFQILRRDLAQLLEDNMNGHYVDLESFASECTD
ncbi:serine-rich adhesin for platelets-like isoform X2 [Vespa mandarinia]|uniref:serine-rich adhesin for platelets-like isoform X2 n=1 Tax=Vespa mandarinia TaxID=7446 RepID=UPI00161AB32C|nr:serine-rich adhesin for platelets-like isoform X2 [Vespa mandarinia]